MEKLLTIAIPTYNRCSHLLTLLDALAEEVSGLEDSVNILVSDNASTDDTGKVIESFTAVCPWATIKRNAVNVGGIANVVSCYQSSATDYLWIIGDDDAPVRGALTALVRLLRTERPDIVYLQNTWMSEVSAATRGSLSEPLRYAKLDKVSFARTVNTWFTFLSAIIIRRDQNALADQTIDPCDCDVGQLTWVFQVLRCGTKFLYVDSVCVAATQGNTGGYAVIETFAWRYTEMAKRMLAADRVMLAVLLNRHIAIFLPGLLWGVRFLAIGPFLGENVNRILYTHLRRHFGYWLFLLPIGILPKWAAWPFHGAARLADKAMRRLDRWQIARQVVH